MLSKIEHNTCNQIFMQVYSESLTACKRLRTREVKVGELLLGAGHPIRVQTMTTTDTMDTMATVEQSIRCIEAGAELIRITAPSKNEAENLQNIKDELKNDFEEIVLEDKKLKNDWQQDKLYRLVLTSKNVDQLQETSSFRVIEEH